MSNGETGTTGSGERGSGESLVGKTPRKLNKQEQSDLVKKVTGDNNEEARSELKQLEFKLEKAVRSVKTELERKLVIGGKQKKELDEFYKEVEDETDKIIKGSGSDLEKYKKLKELQVNKKQELARKIEELQQKEEVEGDLNKKVKEVEDEKLRKDAEKLVSDVISLQSRLMVLRGKTKKVEQLRSKFEASKTRRLRGQLEKETKSLIEEQEKIVNEVRKTAQKVENLRLVDQYGGLELIFQQKIDNLTVDKQRGLGDEVKQFLEIESKLDLLKGAEAYQAPKLTIHIKKEINEAVASGKLSESEAKEWLDRLSQVSKEKEKKVVEKHDHKQGVDESKGFSEKIIEENEARVKQLDTEEGKKLIELIKQDDVDPAEINKLIRRLESNPETNDKLLEELKVIRRGNFEQYRDDYYNWRKKTESQLRADRMLDDPKREIVEIAMKRIIENGGALAVTEEDVQAWVKERLALVMGGGGESTGYYVRQFLGEISGIMGGRDLGFGQLIARDKTDVLDYIGRSIPNNANEKDIAEIEKRVSGYKNALSLFEKSGDEHIGQVSNEFKRMIDGSLVVYQLTQAYEHSGNAEDMVRPMSAAEGSDIGWTLEMEEVRRDIVGRLGFYEVEINEKTGKRKMLSTTAFNSEEVGIFEDRIGQLHTAELKKGGVNLEIALADGRKIVLGSEKLEELLRVEADKVGVEAGDIMDIINQERFANGVLSRREKVAEHFKAQVVREAIMLNMGLVNVDGEVQIKAIEKIIAEKYGEGAGLKFRRMSDGKELTSDKDFKSLRLKMIVNQIGDKRTDLTMDGLEREMVEYTDMDGTKHEVSVLFGGVREKSLDHLENEYKMVFTLGKGMWDFTGLSIAHWNKDHGGDSKDWHLKILNFVEHCMMYGIGPGHIREHVNVNYGDFITERKGDILPELFGSHTMLGKDGKKLKKDSDVEFERDNLIKMLMTDRDGMVMSRNTFLDILGHYRDLGENKGNEFIEGLLLEKAQYQFGQIEGKRIVNRHWGQIKKIDWTEVIKKGKGGQGAVPKGEKLEGFNGLYWWIKNNYTYANLKWGRGGHPTDKTWSQRLFKEAQYLFSAEKFRGMLLAWMGGSGISSPDKMLAAVGTPGYYGTNDYNRKTKLLFRKWGEWTSRPILGLETTEVNRHSNIAVNRKSDTWDRTRRYQKERVLPGTCLAKRDRGIGPYTASQKGEVINQVQRDGKLMPGDANELRGETEELGLVASWLNLQAEKRLGPASVLAKPIVGALFGFNVPLLKIPGTKIVIMRDKRFAGVLGWLWKIIYKYISDTWAVKGEILRGMKDATLEQAGSAFKQG
ncbi:MAG: hypothetical protein ABII08_04940 [Candidatus Beckwithbacteria bacterium]